MVCASAVSLPNDEMKGRIIGREGRNIKVFEAATGVTLLIDESPQMVLISSFDPVRRRESAVVGGALHVKGAPDAVLGRCEATTDVVAVCLPPTAGDVRALPRQRALRAPAGGLPAGGDGVRRA